MSLDLAVLNFINVTIANNAFDFFFRVICDFDLWRWPIILVALALLWKGGVKGRWVVLIAVVTALIVDPSIARVFKPLFGRLRPCHDPAVIWLRLIDGCGGRYGFPSSHAANSFALAVVFGSFYRKTRYYLFPLAAMIAIGRVYLGVHYPSDVLAGAAYGSLIALGVIYGAKKIKRFEIGKFLDGRNHRGGEAISDE